MMSEPRPDPRTDSDHAPGGGSPAEPADNPAAQAQALEGISLEDPMFSTMTLEGDPVTCTRAK